MKILIFLFIISMPAYSGDLKLAEVRTLFGKSATDEASCVKLLSLLEKLPRENSTLIAYKAVATMMMAKFVFNPYSKLSKFNEGKRMLDQSVGSDNNNIETRFLRFVVQTNSPQFLGYNTDISNDKKFIFNLIDKVMDAELKDMIIEHMITSVFISHEEKLKLRS